MDLVLLVKVTDNEERALAVTVEVTEQVGGLARAIAVAAGLPDQADLTLQVTRTGGVLPSSSTLAEAALRNGEHVSLVADPGQTQPRHTGPELVMTEGPEPGRRWPLAPGSVVIGRSKRSDVHVPDALASRRHAVLTVDADGLTLSDIDSLNGTEVDGVPLKGSVALRPGQRVTIADSTFVVQGGTGTSSRVSEGRLLFNRPPRVMSADEAPSLTLPQPPEEAGKVRLPLVASLIPLLMGVGLYAVTGQKASLAFAAMSPVMAIASFLESRKSGKAGQKAALTTFHTRLQEVTDLAEAAHAAVGARRRSACPPAARLVETVLAQSPGLWERTPHDPDFLRLCVGQADQPSRLRLDLPQGGSAPNRTDAEQVQTRFAIDGQVAAELDLRRLGVLGIAGTMQEGEAAARALIGQAVALHSPRDLAVVALVAPERAEAWEWLRWLPHTEVLAKGVGARTVASVEADVTTLFTMVQDLLAVRREDRQRSRLDGGWSPTVLLLVDAGVNVSQPALADLLADSASQGIVAICLGSSPNALPRGCRAVLELGGNASLVETKTGQTVTDIAVDALEPSDALSMAHELAGLHDASADRGSGSLPGVIGLLDVLQVEDPTGPVILERWQQHRPGIGGPLAMAAAGLFELDLRRQGPHALIAGTTGAGKSELLQTMVVSAAASHSPERLNFVLVDFKGNAAFKDVVPLPHVVGSFTDLDPALAARALVSLDAELKHREHVLAEHGAKDLEELELLSLENAPAALVIVFDEFAFLKKTNPDFIRGIVDIAQRGRSLGVHLVLATQRPAGVVDEDIRANTNVFIALRVQSPSDSTEVLGKPDAASLPERPRGRAFVKVGGGEPALTQIAYSGAVAAGGPPPVEVGAFGFGPKPASMPTATKASASRGETDLRRIVRACKDAYAMLGVGPLRPPWLPNLPTHLRLSGLEAIEEAGRLLAVGGLVDEPARQRQVPWAADLSRDGHLLVLGMSGAGKTTLVRTLIASLAQRFGSRDLVVYGLDYATGGLSHLEQLPQCGGVVYSNEPERAERLLDILTTLVEERRELLARSGASSAEDYRARQLGPMPAVVVALDGFGNFTAAFDRVDNGALLEAFSRLVAEGRALGVHLLITADRRGVLPMQLISTLSSRVVLRLADPDEYGWLGLPARCKTAALPSGRGFVEGGLELQVAQLGPARDDVADLAVIAEIARGLPAAEVQQVQLLPTSVTVASLPASTDPLMPLLGLDGRRMHGLSLDLRAGGSLLVCGRDETGRSTTLGSLAEQLVSASASLPAYLLAPRKSPLSQRSPWTDTARGAEECAELAEELVQVLLTQAEDKPLLVVVDDAEHLWDGRTGEALSRLLANGRDRQLILLAAVHTTRVAQAYNGWIRELRNDRHGVLLVPDTDSDGELLGAKLPRRSTAHWPAGRGFYINRSVVAPVQVATA